MTVGASSYSSSWGYRCAALLRGRSVVKMMRPSLPYAGLMLLYASGWLATLVMTGVSF